MKQTFAIDFGSDLTIIASKAGIREKDVAITLSGYATDVSLVKQDSREISCVSVPSLIYYNTKGDILIGDAVIRAGLAAHPSTVRGMKHYIQVGSPASTTINGNICRYCDAGTDFLSFITGVLAGSSGPGGIELVFTVPPGSTGLFEEQVSSMLALQGIRNFRFCDELHAGLAASGFPLERGSLFLFYDHGGDSLRVSVVIIDDDDHVPGGLFCRVLGFASDGTGGKAADSLIADAIINKNGLSVRHAKATGFFEEIKNRCTKIKETLSDFRTSEYSFDVPGLAFSGSISQDELEHILRSGGFFDGIENTVRRALDISFSRGYAETEIKGVVMAGGCCSIPCIRTWMENRFGTEKVFCSSPSGTIARGALLVSSNTTFSDSVRNDYAVRSWNSSRGTYDYQVLVRRGTRIPCNGPVARLQIKATYDGQSDLGILVYEIISGPDRTDGTSREIVHEVSGSVKLLEQPPDPGDNVHYRPVNEKEPIFINANPPAVAGETRFDVSFTIDGGGYLRMTARDRKTGRIVHADSPVARLK